MATIVGDKVKLANYTYQLSLDGKSIEGADVTSGTRGPIEKVIDAFDIDWRPYKISYTLGTKDYSYEVAFSYQILDSIGTLFSYTLLGSTYEGHYMPYDDITNTYATRGTGEYIEEQQHYINAIVADGKGHVTKITYGSFGTSAGTQNTTAPLSGTKHAVTYLTGVYLQEGHLSYSYSNINFTNTKAGKDSSDYSPTYIIANVNMTYDGNFTYTYVDATTTEGAYSGDMLLVGTTTFFDCPKVITGITQNQYGVISYTYSYLHAETTGNVNANPGDNGDYVTKVIISDSGELTGDVGFFTYANDGADATGNTAYITGVSISHDGKVSYKYANINHTCEGEEGDNIVLKYTYTDTDSTKFITGIGITASGEISYTYSPLRVTNADSAGVLTYLNDSADDVYDGSMHVVTNIYRDTVNEQLSWMHADISLTNRDITDGGSTTLTDDTKINVITGITQLGNGKIAYQYNNINTTHTSLGTEHTTVGSHVITNAYLDKNGNYSYTYRDIAVTSGYNTSASDFQLTYDNRIKVLTGITQSSDGQITYSYTDIYTDFTLSKDEGDFIDDIVVSHDGEVIATKKRFGANDGTVDDKASNSYIVGITIDSSGKATYTYGHIMHTNTKSDNSADATLTATYFDVLTNVYLDQDGNFSYQYTPINIGNAKEAETLTYLEHEEVEWGGGAKTVSNIYKRATDNRITFDTIDLVTDLTTTADHSQEADVTITNSTKVRVISDIYQYSDGKVTYTYTDVNTTHSFDSTGTAQDKVITNVNITPDGLLSYNVTDLTVSNGIESSWEDYKSTDTVEKVPMTATTAKRVLSGITQSGNGKISYSYTAIYTDPVNDYRYHEFNINASPNLTDDYPTSDSVAVLSGISTSNGNSIVHDVSYSTVQVATMAYVTKAFSLNDAMRYCGTFDVQDNNLKLTHTATGSAHTAAGTPDITAGAVYKSTYHGVINGIAVQVGDTIVANGNSTSATDLSSGWDIYQVNLNIQSEGTSSLNTAENKRLISNVYIDDNGLLSYTYYDLAVSTLETGIKTPESYTNTFYNINSSTTAGEVTKGTQVITGVILSQNGTETTLTYSLSSIYSDTHHHSTTYEAGDNDQGRGNPKVISAVHLDYDGNLTYSYSTINVSSNHYVTEATWFNTAADDKSTIISYGASYTNSSMNPVISLPSEYAGEMSQQIVETINVDNLGHTTYVGTSKMVHALISNSADLTKHSTYIASGAGAISTSDTTYAFATAGTSVVTGFSTNDTGHVKDVIITTVTDENIKTVNDESTKKYLVGVSTENTTSTGLTDSKIYTQGNTTYTENLNVANDTVLGTDSADTVTLNAKTIIINKETVNPVSVTWENLDLLWGTLS